MFRRLLGPWLRGDETIELTVVPGHSSESPLVEDFFRNSIEMYAPLQVGDCDETTLTELNAQISSVEKGRPH